MSKVAGTKVSCGLLSVEMLGPVNQILADWQTIKFESMLRFEGGTGWTWTSRWPPSEALVKKACHSLSPF